MQDLLELGLADFVRLPLCPDEFRARLLATVARVPRPGTLRESDHPGQTAWLQAIGILPQAATVSAPNLCMPVPEKLNRRRNLGGRPVRGALHSRSKKTNQSADAASVLTMREPFQDAKAKLIEGFEREYIEQALERSQGNIARAARTSNKHRRAFWALMRKHEIDAEQYRPEDLTE
jgi:DNA-binding NtrC family response regulator